MKALDKVRLVIIVGMTDKSFHQLKKISLYEEGKKTDKKDGIKATVTEENPTGFI